MWLQCSQTKRASDIISGSLSPFSLSLALFPSMAPLKVEAVRALFYEDWELPVESVISHSQTLLSRISFLQSVLEGSSLTVEGSAGVRPRA